MDLRFIKLRLCEADLILIDDLDGEGRDRDWPEAARRLLDRRKGVGSLRLAVVSRQERDIWLRCFDDEGATEVARFDAALCAARYLHDSGLVASGQLAFRSGKGELAIDILDGSSLGLSLGPLISIPEGRPLDSVLAEERRSIIVADGESYEALPLALEGFSPRGGGESRTAPVEGEAAMTEGPRAVAVFCAGGTKAVRAKIGSSGRGRHPPSALPVRVLSRGEIRIGGLADPRLDACSQAGLAFGAALLTGLVEGEVLVRSGSGALWAELTSSGSVYVAGRPDYVFQGEFHIEDGAGADRPWKAGG